MADILSIISIASFVAAGISLAVAIIFWINFKIPKIIGDLTGRTARKSIAKIRASNEASGNKPQRSSAADANRGKPIDAAFDSSKQNKRPLVSAAFDDAQTDIIEENKASAGREDSTAVLNYDATELLSEGEETELLAKQVQTKHRTAKKLRMLDEVIYIHTDEVIE